MSEFQTRSVVSHHTGTQQDQRAQQQQFEQQQKQQQKPKMNDAKQFVIEDLRLFFLPITAVWKAVIKELKA